MTTRKEQKARTLDTILSVTARRIREEGVNGAAIASVMKEAGLTHGAFYAHFSSKDELAREAFSYAVSTNQRRWFARSRKHGKTFAQRLKQLAADYLSPLHRDSVGSGCAISALASSVPGASEDFKNVYSDRLTDTFRQISEDNENLTDEAIVFLSLCVGGLLLSRGVTDEKESRRILAATRREIDRLADTL